MYMQCFLRCKWIGRLLFQYNFVVTISPLACLQHLLLHCCQYDCPGVNFFFTDLQTEGQELGGVPVCFGELGFLLFCFFYSSLLVL